MAFKAVCKQCNVVIACRKNAVNFFDMFCPTCGSKLSRYNSIESWRLSYVFFKASEIREASEKGLEKASKTTTRKEV